MTVSKSERGGGRQPRRMSRAGRNLVRFLIVAAVGCVLYVGATSLAIGGHRAEQGVDDIGELVVALLAAGCCLLASYRRSGRDRWAWGLLGASVLVWAGGQAVWTYLEMLAKDAIPFPSLADAGYLGFVPLAVAGTLCFSSGRRSASSRIRSLIDGLSIAAALLAVSWSTVLGVVYAINPPTSFAALISLAYPVSDVLVATLILALGLRAPVGGRLPLILVAAGLLLNCVGDSSFAYLTSFGTFATGSTLNVAWIAGFLLVAGGALYAAHPGLTRSLVGRGDFDLPSRLSIALTLIPVGAAVVCTIAVKALAGRLSWVLIDCLVAIVLLGAIRQVLAVTENRGLLVQLRRAAHEDALTGLPNRSSLNEFLTAAINSAGVAGNPAVLYLDVDGFKAINDGMGHIAGDQLLDQLGGRLRHALREGDFVARMGGDEFVIVVKSVPREGLESVARRSQAVFDAPFTLHGSQVMVKSSMGIATLTRGDETADELLRNADAAMYRAKRSGPGRWQLFDPSAAAA